MSMNVTSWMWGELPYGSLVFWLMQPVTMEKRKRRTKTAARWTFTKGNGREGQRMVIG